jgi:PTH1 family peptidyl-tRNA hydrolase
MNLEQNSIKAIIGLGNPGKQFESNRHNIGFTIVDNLGIHHQARWKKQADMEVASIEINGKPVLLIKPQTFMNSSGKVIPYLAKQGIKPENILVVHDELELPFGQIKLKKGGSAKGHNGLKSIISVCGPEFYRLRFGIGRPQNQEDVPEYVLQNFKENKEELEQLIEQAVGMIEELFK